MQLDIHRSEIFALMGLVLEHGSRLAILLEEVKADPHQIQRFLDTHTTHMAAMRLYQQLYKAIGKKKFYENAYACEQITIRLEAMEIAFMRTILNRNEADKQEVGFGLDLYLVTDSFDAHCPTWANRKSKQELT